VCVCVITLEKRRLRKKKNTKYTSDVN